LNAPKSCLFHQPANNVLQRTFDPLPIFAYAKTGIASNTAELWRYTKI
jgi:hypothetical protein